ncbi:MAG: N-methyl-L-tryptophan oxidase [Planctomycetes bacterium]|nr:N-methyl-L-tryptophan oxidase [Planctomycetota bacterium]
MTAKPLDCIVLGAGGGAGSAALFHLARRGARVLGLDRFEPGHDRGSSHGETRIIRRAYFEHPGYVPLLLRAYELWADLEARSGRRLLVETGLLQVGPPDGAVVPGVLRSAREHGLEVEELAAAEIEGRFPGFRAPPGFRGVLERRAGYLLVEECVRAHAAEARRLGAELRAGRAGDAALEWRAEGGGVAVRTGSGEHRAASLVIAPGPWAPALLRGLGLALEVRRKPLLWYRTATPDYRADRGAPAFLFELPEGVFYGFPEIAGGELKVSEHTGGERVEDPLRVDRSLRDSDRAPVERFLARQLPGVTPECLRHAVCMYTMTPDEHFVLGRHPAHARVAFAAGLSGHGFKLTCVLGEALADLALDGATRLPVGFLGPERAGLRGI